MSTKAKEKVSEFLSTWLKKAMEPGKWLSEDGMFGFLGGWLKKFLGNEKGEVDTRIVGSFAADTLFDKPDPTKPDSLIVRLVKRWAGEEEAPPATGQPGTGGQPAGGTETPEQKTAREAREAQEKADREAAERAVAAAAAEAEKAAAAEAAKKAQKQQPPIQNPAPQDAVSVGGRSAGELRSAFSSPHTQIGGAPTGDTTYFENILKRIAPPSPTGK